MSEKVIDAQSEAVIRPWHTLTAEAVPEVIGVDLETGLEAAEVERRTSQYGPNELVEKGTKSPMLILWEQLIDPMVLILIGAAVVSAFLGEGKSVVAISAIVILNALLGVTQEYRAEQAMAALKKMAAPSVRVRRDGRVTDVPPSTLVPGDVVLLEAGSIVPADARIVESANLQVQEASLTGESHPIDKTARALFGEDIALGDRHNMVYLGTSVTYGRATAIVVATGMQTQLGRIASLIQGVEGDKTPLQRRMAQLGRVLFFVGIAIVAAAFVLGLLIGNAVNESFLNAVAIAVAAVPEGLPAVVTISLALGAQRMLRRRALIRKLPAVETLGSVTVICSDKTGTLTENRMTVKVIDVAGYTHDITDIVMRSKRVLTADSSVLETPTGAEALLLTGAELCNDALLERVVPGERDLTAIGDPTEGALLVAAGHFGMWKGEIEDMLPRVAEVPFSSERKRMATLHRFVPDAPLDSEGESMVREILMNQGKPYFVFVKGGVDSLLSACDRVWEGSSIHPMTDSVRQRIVAANDNLARDGLRVLGVAFKALDALPDDVKPESVEHDLIFTGMVGMIDPPRVEVRDAVARSRAAGMRPVMITGDHPLTAQAIAHELDISRDDVVITGAELARMSPEELREKVETVSVYARVSPEHKLNIVQALQERGHIVAMTGDGVNDAPALKRADIGVAMGITGTAVSKEASEMVILDDNFATIVDATEEGRTIYDNVRKFVKYILASNIGEVMVLFIIQLLGMPLPLNTIQILWMNLVTDGLPALALGVEKGEPNAMNRPPHDPQEGMFARGLGGYLVRIGLLIAAITLFVVLVVPAPEGDDARNTVWGTMIFTTLVMSQMGHALAIRSERDSVFKLGIFSNRAILAAIGLTTGLQLVLIYTPFAQDFFYTAPLSALELGFCFTLATITFVGVEFDKWFFNRRKSARHG
ncbi:MAG: cation-translocating P-type ATPase [Chloroflexota bacterium]